MWIISIEDHLKLKRCDHRGINLIGEWTILSRILWHYFKVLSFPNKTVFWVRTCTCACYQKYRRETFKWQNKRNSKTGNAFIPKSICKVDGLGLSQRFHVFVNRSVEVKETYTTRGVHPTETFGFYDVIHPYFEDYMEQHRLIEWSSPHIQAGPQRTYK